MGFTLLVGGFTWFASSLGRMNLPVELALNVKSAGPPVLTHEWRLVDGKHWQIVPSSFDALEDREVTDRTEGNRGACPIGMIEVRGQMKLDPSPTAYFNGNSIEEMQKSTCTQWINKDYPERCGKFDREKWLEIGKELATKPMHFCIDRYEFPNQKGAFPVILANWYEAVELCAVEGKRMCDEAEWTFACEGEEATPYPYGYERDVESCVVDRPWKPFNEVAMRPRDGAPAMAEMDRLWQGVASGSRPRCKSSFGVFDMTGNVDEWTRSVRDGERPSILKGGYWGPVRTRCRPSTRSHDENHMFYQQGVRCCGDAGAPAHRRAISMDPALAPLPRELK